MTTPKAAVRYVYFLSADGHYESWNLPSAMHPQALMVYQENNQPLLSIENELSLRVASPIKLGDKRSKWETRIFLTHQLLLQKGCWEDQGYEWFAGID